MIFVVFIALTSNDYKYPGVLMKTGRVTYNDNGASTAASVNRRAL